MVNVGRCGVSSVLPFNVCQTSYEYKKYIRAHHHDGHTGTVILVPLSLSQVTALFWKIDPVEFIYESMIFKWVAETRWHCRVSG